ncbi:MAG: MarR family transcriptional regulator [Clostridiales bacterium]|nr:MarR family transcriptional regulator [Clostridiales bacterium]MCD8126088.1 MarR family transcriptional regulator [Clostridiales bacterium]
MEQESGAAPITQREQLYELMEYATRFIHHYLGRGKGQGRILYLLNRNGAMTQQELQGVLHIQSSSISEILTKLETAGFITRQRDEADKRRCIVAITQAGIADLTEHEAARQERRAMLYDCLTPEEEDELVRILTKLRARWDALPPRQSQSPQPAKREEEPTQ